MPPLFDLQRAALRDFGAAVLVFFGDRGEGNEAVEQRDRPRNPLKNGNIARKHFHKLSEQMLFEPGSRVRAAEDLPFQIFEFLRRIAHAVRERLSGNVGIGNFILKGVGHFNVIAEHAVKPDFQVADPRALPLARFKLQHERLAVVLHGAQFVELFAVSAADIVPLFQRRRVGRDRPVKQIADLFGIDEIARDLAKERRRKSDQLKFEIGHSRKRGRERKTVARL